MRVRIRFRYRAAADTSAAMHRHAVSVASAMMTPLALMAWALGGWRLAADLKWTGEFAIARGIFSHWQVWFALGIALQFCAFLLHRYVHGDEDSDGGAVS